MILAREIDRNPKVLIAAQPTRGLDVGAIEFVHRRLVEERDEGRAMLLVSLELEEIVSLSDRILVMFEGEIVGEFPPSVSEEELGIAMTGGGRRRGGRVSGDCRREAAAEAPSGLAPRAANAPSVASRYALAQKAGGIVVPLLTVALAFLIGGIVVFVTTGSNPLSTYKAIFEGAGLNWFSSREVRPTHVPGSRRHGAYNLQQTLLDSRRRSSSPASPSRSRSAAACSTSAARGSTWSARSSASGSARRCAGLPASSTSSLASSAATLAGALWAGIAGFLKATVGRTR